MRPLSPDAVRLETIVRESPCETAATLALSLGRSRKVTSRCLRDLIDHGIIDGMMGAGEPTRYAHADVFAELAEHGLL